MLQILLDKIKTMPGPIWYIQTLKMFGDTLHGTIVVSHYNSTKPNGVKILWGISEKYINEYKEFTICDKIGLPHDMPMKDRIALTYAVEKLANVKKVIRPLVGEWGWNTAGSIVDNVLHNAGITKLAVPRKPVLPVGIEDYAWSDAAMKTNKLTRYGTLEYNSYSLCGPPHNAIKPTSWYNKMLSKVRIPIVYIGGPNDHKLDYGRDFRGCTYRQAKVMIMRSKLFVGCGSGLTMIAATTGMSTPIIELGIGDTISMNGCGYAKSRIITSSNTEEIAAIINGALGG